MLTPVKNRKLSIGQIVQVYKNLNRNCFSIRDKKSGLVIAYCNSVTIENARFYVSAAGHARVLRTGVRNVHAYVEGSFHSVDKGKQDYYFMGYYNPFKTCTFIHEETGAPLEFARVAHCKDDRVYYLP